MFHWLTIELTLLVHEHLYLSLCNQIRSASHDEDEEACEYHKLSGKAPCFLH